MSRASSILRLAAQLARVHLHSTAFPAAAAAAPSCCRAASVVQPTLLRNWAPAAAQMHSSSASLQEVQQQAGVQQQQHQRPRPPDNAPMAPWTPTKDLRKRKTYTKRMGFMLQVLEKEHEEKLAAERKHPDFGPGDVLQLKLVVPENKRRTALFKGICIAKRNRGVRTTFTLRNFLGNAGAIERTFPLYSPNIVELQVLESRRVRRSKLYYLRDRQPREYRV